MRVYPWAGGIVEGFQDGSWVTYNSTVADLDGLDHVQHQLGALAGEDQTITGQSSGLDLIGEGDGLQGSSDVGDDTGHSEVEGLLGDGLQAEGVLDDFLYIGKRLISALGPRCAAERLDCPAEEAISGEEWKTHTASVLIPAIMSGSSPSCGSLISN